MMHAKDGGNVVKVSRVLEVQEKLEYLIWIRGEGYREGDGTCGDSDARSKIWRS